MEKIVKRNVLPSDDYDEEDDDDDDEMHQIEGAYDPSEFESLNVSNDIKNIFNYITCYTTQTMDLDVKLKTFIPDYIPSAGDTDAFIKIERPDKKEDTIGLTVLDEPSAKSQSDSTLLSLRLRAVSKDVNVTREIGSAITIASNGREIDSWIQNIGNLHDSTTNASTNMTLFNNQKLPEIEQLMQEWPEEFERALSQYSLPSADNGCSLEEYVNIICAFLDIPVHSSKIASLHLLFSLYNEFQNSQHFKRF